MAPHEALIKARESVFKSDQEERKERLSQFNNAASFKPGALEETAASNLPDAELFFGNNRISDEAKYTFKEFARQGFLETGTKDGAIGYATELMKKNYGTSDISGSRQFTRNPIEKRYRNIPVSYLRTALFEDNKSLIPEGAVSDSISLVADDFTGERIRVTKDGQEKVAPTWMVTVKKKYGDTPIEVPIPDPITGKPKRWGPAYSDYINGAKDRERLLKEQQLTEAKKSNEEFRAQGGNRIHPALKKLHDIFKPISNYVNEK
jgi:hypothetical protein